MNLVATWQLAKANRENMAVEGSFQHILTDLYAFVGTAIAGVIIVTTGYVRADPIASLFVAALMLRASYGLLKDSGRVLLEMAPARMSAQEIGEALAAHSRGQRRCTTCTSGRSEPTCPRCRPTCSSGAASTATPSGSSWSAMLHERFDIEHTTLQVDHVRESPLVELRKLSDSGR